MYFFLSTAAAYLHSTPCSQGLESQSIVSYLWFRDAFMLSEQVCILLKPTYAIFYSE